MKGIQTCLPNPDDPVGQSCGSAHAFAHVQRQKCRSDLKYLKINVARVPGSFATPPCASTRCLGGPRLMYSRIRLVCHAYGIAQLERDAIPRVQPNQTAHA